MKFSLKDIFDSTSNNTDSPTRKLLESYGIIDESESSQDDEVKPDKPGEDESEVDDNDDTSNILTDTDDKTTATEGVVVQKEHRTLRVNRDDLVLSRWRTMAGL